MSKIKSIKIRHPKLRRAWNDWYKQNKSISTKDCAMIKTIAVANFQKFGVLDISQAAEFYADFMQRMLESGQIKEWK